MPLNLPEITPDEDVWGQQLNDSLIYLDGKPGIKGDKGDTGNVGPAGGTDAATANWVGTGPLTTAALAANYASTASFVRRPAGGTTTTGDVILLGQHAYAANGIATAAVLGGAPNYENVIGGNPDNVDTPTSNLTGAPALTGTDGNWNFILGGYDNVVNGWANAITGYHCKVIAGANHATISGGSKHIVGATTAYGTIGGGTVQEIAGNNPTIGGGNTNKATNNSATVSGGQGNTASGNGATVGGGVSNTASANNSTIVGGQSNTATDLYATVTGGLTCTASGVGAVVPGGRDNVAAGQYSVATGRGAVVPATEAGMHAHAQAGFTTPGDAQLNRYSLKVQTTSATAADLGANTGAPPVIPVDTTWAFSALIVARRADVDGDNAAFEVKGCFKRDAGNTAGFVGTPVITSLGASAGASTWTVTAASFSVGTLRFTCTGEAGKTIRWVGELRATQVSG